MRAQSANSLPFWLSIIKCPALRQQLARDENGCGHLTRVWLSLLLQRAGARAYWNRAAVHFVLSGHIFSTRRYISCQSRGIICCFVFLVPDEPRFQDEKRDEFYLPREAIQTIQLELRRKRQDKAVTNRVHLYAAYLSQPTCAARFLISSHCQPEHLR